VALPSDAVAHIAKGEAAGFFSGSVHPIRGLDHIIAIVAAGPRGAQLGALRAAGLSEVRPQLWIAAVLVGIFGLFHGYAHAAQLPPGQNALLYSAGFVLATGLLHSTGITIGLVYRWPWGKILLRGAGGLVPGGGLIFLWGAIA
jgi:urease accessory protein